MGSSPLHCPDELEVLEMLAAVVRSLVDEPGDVEVVPIVASLVVTFQIRANAAAMGKVIGRQGRVARALRVIVQANAARLKRDLRLDIVSREAALRQTSVTAASTELEI
jgi:predicted RNA-binding protein YlqC (UPF0109 family)